MIGYFPIPYPDELFYSLCARYTDRMQYPSICAVGRDLFGRLSHSAVVDLPGYLETFAAALPPGHPCQVVEQLIDQHTLLPVYRPFLPAERLDKIQLRMRREHGVPVYTGLNGGAPVLRLDWLRFCPQCVEQDRHRFGESYWHRVHQVPGVEVCPTHAVLLENSRVPTRYNPSRDRFVPAEGMVWSTPSRTLAASDPCQAPLLRLAQEVAWLLTQPALEVTLETLCQRYEVLLIERGLASYRGLIKSQELLTAFRAYYSDELLALLHCRLDLTLRRNWLLRLPTIHAFQPPLRHLLLIHFFGYTLETWLKLPTTYHPFGQAPWPCLNPVCPQYRQPAIQTCQLEYKESGRVSGVFACSCGFVYVRGQPDRSADDCFRAGKYLAFGPVWEAELRRLWTDPTLSLRQMALRLGVDLTTVTRQAAKLGCPFPPPGAKLKPNSTLTQRPSLQPQTPSPATYQQQRAKWLAALAANPEFSRRTLQRSQRSLYDWLHRHDKEWLMAHLPPPRQSRPPQPRPSRVNWEERDGQLVHEVRLAAERLSHRPGRPTRISLPALRREIRTFALLPKPLDKLPLTRAVLAQVLETHEAYGVRKVRWAAACYQQEGVQPTRSQLVLRARVDRTQKSPQVQQALDMALAQLSKLP